MIVKTLTVGKIIPTNSYFYIDEKSKHGFLIDAGDNTDILVQEIENNDWKIEKILLTHGHFDHIGAVDELSKKLNIPYYIHRNGQQYLSNPDYNLSIYFAEPITLKDAKYFTDNEEIILEADKNIKLKVLHTPGHTADSVTFYDTDNGIAFCGDTIFKSSVGRTDIPGGDSKQLSQSIKQKILTLPDDTLLYSGHSTPTTVGAERNHNLFIL
jgi:glyoxylase-like metal-dependent hydrolase (beta-lactamase superfamily II)